MTEAPERIFRNCRITGEIEAEYIRKDVSDALLKAEREKALREAAEIVYRFGLRVTGDTILALISEDATDG